MIFATVGTHEQGIDRLFEELDELIDKGVIKEEVFAQIGYSNYIPKNYKFTKIIGYDEMDELVRKSDIVITHGGPASIFHPIQYGKTPIVVPRNPEFNEHVDDHQILFTKRMEESGKVIGVYNINDLEGKIINYNKLAEECDVSHSNATKFIEKFDKLINERLVLKK